MKVALTVWKGRISPLFDSTQMLLVAEVNGKKIASTHLESFDCDSPITRAARLIELGISLLICGGISSDFAIPIEAQGIPIIAFATGTAEEVLEDYLQDN